VIRRPAHRESIPRAHDETLGVELSQNGKSARRVQGAGGDGATTPRPPRASDPSQGRLSPPASRLNTVAFLDPAGLRISISSAYRLVAPPGEVR
jgi:hypothetical protein